MTIGIDNNVSSAKLIVNDYKIEYNDNDGVTSVIKGHVKLENIKIKKVAVSLNGTSFVIDEEGALYGWGHNNIGQLGDETTTDSLTPIKIMEGTTFKSVVGFNAAIAVDSSDNIFAWGYNSLGLFGNGTTTNSSTPIQVLSGRKFKTIALSSRHILAVDLDGKLYAWGWNYYGQLGNGSTTDSTTPIEIKIKEGISFIAD